MRTAIYYWKCDNPQSVAEKRRSYFKEKYERRELPEMVGAAFRAVFGAAPESVEPLRADGNHIAFVVTLGQKRYFFRADDGSGDDDYLLAESRLMRLAAAAGVPTPEVFHTDVSRTACPLRYQIMAHCAEPCLNLHDRAGTLDRDAVAGQLGRYLRRLHGIRLEGFGFINTEELRQTGKLVGLDDSCGAYFRKRLDEHVDYLEEHRLLDAHAAVTVREVFARHAARLERPFGVLIHRDLALWNVLGTPATVTAIIDWDDAVSGDPADDLGMISCFYGDAFVEPILTAYWAPEPVPDDFRGRVALYLLRNMLWKAKLRHALGYFDKPGDFFLNAPGERRSLRELTLAKLNGALKQAEGCG